MVWSGWFRRVFLGITWLGLLTSPMLCTGTFSRREASIVPARLFVLFFVVCAVWVSCLSVLCQFSRPVSWWTVVVPPSLLPVRRPETRGGSRAGTALCVRP